MATSFRATDAQLEERTMLSAVVGLVSDINQVATSPTGLTDVNGKVFFLTSDGAASTQSLWASDGTAVGTKEIFATNVNPTDLTSIGGGIALFAAAHRARDRNRPG